MKIAKILFGVSLILMPLSYGTKMALNIDALWINPALIFGLLVFMLLQCPLGGKPVFFVFISSAISALIGGLCFSPDKSSIDGLYTIFREPIRLWLNIALFSVVLYYYRRDSFYVIKMIAISIAIQFVVSLYIVLSVVGIAYLPAPINTYFVEAAQRQVVWFGNAAIPRLVGTFWESPPYGLFMFTGFSIILLYINQSKQKKYPLIFASGCGFLGTIGSLADQVLLGMLAFFIAHFFLNAIKAKRILRGVIIAILLFVSAFYVADRIIFKLQEAQDSTNIYSSAGERIYHSQLVMNILEDSPYLLLTGIGPGRYGEYAARYGSFPDSVTVQFTLMEWIGEYGFMGLGAMLIFVFDCYRKAIANYGISGGATWIGIMLANMFQSNWKWEIWFVAMAVLACDLGAVRDKDVNMENKAVLGDYNEHNN